MSAQIWVNEYFDVLVTSVSLSELISSKTELADPTDPNKLKSFFSLHDLDKIHVALEALYFKQEKNIWIELTEPLLGYYYFLNLRPAEKGNNTNFVVTFFNREEVLARDLKETKFNDFYKSIYDEVSYYKIILCLDDMRVFSVNRAFVNDMGGYLHSYVGKAIKDIQFLADTNQLILFKSLINKKNDLIDMGEKYIDFKGNQEQVIPVKISLSKVVFGGRSLLVLSAHAVTAQRVFEKQTEALIQETELASRAKTEFLANISHELRTPLNAIIGFSQIMKDQVMGQLGNGQYIDFAKEIYRSGNILLRSINQLLDLAKLEGGNLTLVSEEFDLIALTKQIIADCAVDCKEKLVEPKMYHSSNEMMVMGDKRRMREALYNIARNAIRFSPKSGIVEFALERHEEHTSVTVTDFGLGMTEEELDYARKPFSQISSVWTKGGNDGGLGLGLPLAIGFVKRMGGKVSIRSEANVGTSVTLRLPNA